MADIYDLHRHLGGSISASTVLEIMKRSGTLDGQTYADIYGKMVCDNHAIGFKKFLDKFAILNTIPWHDWAIDLSIRQVCEDLKSEGINYSEISLSINKYLDSNKWKPDYAIQFIDNSFSKYCQQLDIKVGLLLSLQYHSPRAQQLEHANLINNPRIRNILRGIDLIGDEEKFDPYFYKPIFKKWRNHHKICRAHVGEMPGSGQNVRIAIEELGTNRIAHGIQADEDILKFAIDKNIGFDLALHSNMITGACIDMYNHPIKQMLNLGCIVTLNTDDPVQFACSLRSEFDMALKYGLINRQQSRIIMDNAIRQAGI